MKQFNLSVVFFVLYCFCWSAVATNTHPDLNHVHSILQTNDWKTYITNIDTDSQGSIIAVGYTKQPVVFTSPFIRKYSSQLVLEWDLPISDSVGEKILVSLDAEDNIYVAGYFGKMKSYLQVADTPKNESNRIITTSGENDIFVLKVDSNGNLLWMISIGTEAEEIIGNFYVSPQGLIAIAGVRGVDQWFVTKLNSEGSVVWEKPMDATGGFYTNNQFAVAFDTSNNLVVAHSYTSPRKILGEALPHKEKYQHNGLMIKFDEKGEIKWYQTWNLPTLGASSGALLMSREFNAMEIDSEGNIYVAGKDSTNIPLGAIVAKVSAAGKKLWEVKLEGWIEDLKLGADSNVYAVGSYSESYPGTYVWGAIQPTLPPSRRSAAFVVKISPQGQVIWKNTFGGSKFISGNSLAVTQDDKVIIAFGFSQEATFGGETFKTKDIKEFAYVSGVLASYTQPEKLPKVSGKEEL